MQYTTKLKTECKRIGLDAKSKAFADLIALGWDEKDVFIALEYYRSTYSEQYNKQQLESFLNDPSMIRYLSGTRSNIRKKAAAVNEAQQEETAKEVKQMTKEDVLSELVTMLQILDKKDPRRVEILMKYSELQRFKQEEIRDEEKLVHYYMPITCKNCSLYQAAQIRKQNEPTQP